MAREVDDMSLSIREEARMIEYLRACGLTEKQINDCFIYMATGTNLPERSQECK